MKHKFIALLVGLLIISPAVAQDKIKGAIEENVLLSLEDCLQKAYINNPVLKEAESTSDIYNAKIGQAKSNYFPEMSFSSGYNRNNPMVNSVQRFADRYTDNYTLAAIGLEQLIYDFGKTSTQIKFQKKTYEAFKLNAEAILNLVTYEVKQNYYNLLYAMQKEKVLQETVNQFKKQLEQAKAFYEIGTRPKIDVTTADFNYSAAQLRLIQATNDVNIAYANLNNAMGIPEHSHYDVKDQLEYKEKDLEFPVLLEKAYEARPDLKAAINHSEASEELIKLSKRVVVPDLKAFTNFSIGGSDFTEDEGFGAGILLEVPLTNGYKVKKQVEEAKANFSKNQAIQEQVKQKIYLELKQAYIKYTEAGQKIPVSKLSMEQAKENYDLASGRYKVGLGNPIELKDAEVYFSNSQLEYHKSLLEYNLALANLERVIGTTLEESDIGEVEKIQENKK